MQPLKQWCGLAGIPLGVTLTMMAVQALGTLQLLEWAVLNQWFRWRSPETWTVPIVMVTITEADIQTTGRWPLTDQQLAALLKRLKRDRPAVIGLDLYRDLPNEPGHAELRQVFATTPNLIGITKAVSNTTGPAVPAPPVLGDRRQVGSNDLLLDADGIVRRNLLSVRQNDQDILTLGTKVALIYLSQHGVIATGGDNGTCVHLGQAKFCRLDPNAGGHVQVDTGGNQTLSNFLRLPHGIPTVTLTDVMTDRTPASDLRDKIVFIGVKADSVWGDRFYTPYTTDSTTTWAGVELHANVTAQILTSALSGRPLLQGVPQMGGWAWMCFWAGMGTALGWKLRSLERAIVIIPLALGSIGAIGYGAFLLGWWTVTVSPFLSFIIAGLLSRGYWMWHTLKQINQLLELKVQERTQELLEKNLALERSQAAIETANQALEQLSRIDELTQVANRRFFNEYLAEQWHRMMQAQLPLSLVLIDIDFFKLYNDTYGHPAGDDCLAQVARALATAVRRPTDLVARYGGEEFVVILPNTPLVGALQVATDIQSHVTALQIPHQGSQISQMVTLSIGIACSIPSLESSIEELVRATDQALYRAKQEGRNRAIVTNL